MFSVHRLLFLPFLPMLPKRSCDLRLTKPEFTISNDNVDKDSRTPASLGCQFHLPLCWFGPLSRF
jgi:hypothetical protein